MNLAIIKTRIILWFLLFIIIFWLLYKGIVPGGKITYTYDFHGQNKIISNFTPEERIATDNNQKIIGDPVYFSLRVPRKFNKAKIIINYKIENFAIMPIIEVGILVDKNLWRYDLEPLQNSIIDELQTKWDISRENDLILLQRNKKYDNINDFLKNLPDTSKIATYNYELDNDFLLSDYEAQQEEKILNYPLRGNYQFYTYLKNEELFFNFEVIDLNINDSEDPIDINLYYEDQLIDSRHLEDDGINQDNGKIKEARTIKLTNKNLPEGLYKIEFRANDDIITQKITTKQSKLTLINKIWLYDSDKESIKIYTDLNEIKAKIINPDSLQTIFINNENSLNINQTYKQFTKKIPGSKNINEIKLEKDGIIIEGRGAISFEKNALINPEIKMADNNLNIDSIDYIISKYTPPATKDSWKINEVELDLKNAHYENQKYKFIISVPRLISDDEISDQIKIKNIKIELEGTSLWEKIKKYL